VIALAIYGIASNDKELFSVHATKTSARLIERQASSIQPLQHAHSIQLENHNHLLKSFQDQHEKYIKEAASLSSQLATAQQTKVPPIHRYGCERKNLDPINNFTWFLQTAGCNVWWAAAEVVVRAAESVQGGDKCRGCCLFISEDGEFGEVIKIV